MGGALASPRLRNPRASDNTKPWSPPCLVLPHCVTGRSHLVSLSFPICTQERLVPARGGLRPPKCWSSLTVVVGMSPSHTE